MTRRFPRTVIALGIVSFLTDLSSEMIYPLLPAFLVMLGAGGAFVGLVEGIAETTSALTKLLSGLWADKVRRKKPLVVAGYGLASLVRPLVAVAQAPWQVLAIRFTDRIGKGIRTSPRDALLSQQVAPEIRGAAFGFHRAMDHAGALFGPLVASSLLWLGLTHRSVFALAAIPAALAMLVLIAGVRETVDGTSPPPPSPTADAPTSSTAAGDKPRLPRQLSYYLVLVGVFMLANSTDFFLLLRAREVGVPDVYLPILWAMLHLVKSTLSTPLGALSDRLGRRRLIATGWLVYAATYAGFGLATAAWQIWALFLLYGVHSAATEGTEKALVADLSPPALRGRAFGLFHFVTGLTALPASLGFGLLWDRVGHDTAFFVGAGLAALATAGLAGLKSPKVA